MNVIITGASSGIGRGFARTFAQKGHVVMAVARREERLQQLRDDLAEKYSTVVHILALDLTLDKAPQYLFDEAVRVFGKVHVLINNAGMSPYQEFKGIHYDHLSQVLSLNIGALTKLCHLFMPHMLDHGEPSHVVNVGSAGGYAPLPYFSVYTGSKHYVRAFTNMLNHEYRGTNIKVTCLHPGGVRSEFGALAGQRFSKTALNAMMTPDEIAEKTYPSILKGKRVIVPGGLYKLAVIIGKFFPFPWAIRVMKLIYENTMDKIVPSYPLPSPKKGESQPPQIDPGKHVRVGLEDSLD